MITHVAIMEGAKVFSLPNPFRHHHVIHMIFELEERKLGNPVDGIQGFLSSNDIGDMRFVGREEAREIAFANGQTHRLNGILFSEDLW